MYMYANIPNPERIVWWADIYNPTDDSNNIYFSQDFIFKYEPTTNEEFYTFTIRFCTPGGIIY